MKNIMQYLLGKITCKSTYFLAGTVVMNVVALILYYQFGTSVFIPTLSSSAIICMVLGIVLPVVVIFSPVKLPYLAVFFVDLLACFEYLASQASFIANVFVGIDGTTFPVAFYVITLFTLASAVLVMVAMKFVKEPWGEEEEQTEGGQV